MKTLAVRLHRAREEMEEKFPTCACGSPRRRAMIKCDSCIEVDQMKEWL